MHTFDAIADLPLVVESCHLVGLGRVVSSAFERHTTVVRLSGAGEEGVGEDVTYDTGEQKAFQRAVGLPDLAGATTLAGCSRGLDDVDLFPEGTTWEPSRQYRRWGLESAALDLALRQGGRSLADVLGREARPVRFVVSLRLGNPPTIEPLRRLLELYPGLRFKLDPTSQWTDALIEQVAATGAVDVMDFKGGYKGTLVDQPADADLYRRIVQAFPAAWLEDPALGRSTESALAGHEARITWDAHIHSVDDIRGLPCKPRVLNCKPSRFGALHRLLDTYDYCAAQGIGLYGGGQFELGPGRGQIQALAALFHADAPNDVAPRGYNEPRPEPGLPTSPLRPDLDRVGFRWSGD